MARLCHFTARPAPPCYNKPIAAKGEVSMKPKARSIAAFGLLSACALVLSLAERLLIPPLPVPGIKLGLANVAVLICLYAQGPRAALGLSVVRILLVATLYAGISTLLYSAAGGLLSFMVMWALRGGKRFGVPGVSVAGAVAHNIGQLGVAMLVVRTAGLIGYLPVLLVSACITGLVTGIAAQGVLRAIGTPNRI